MVLPTKTTVSRPVAVGYDVRINGTYFRFAKIRDNVPLRDTAPLQPDQVDTNENPEDVRPTFGKIFSRSDFSSGEGLAFAHRRGQDEVHDRFWSSKNIDIHAAGPEEAAHFKLSNSTSVIESSTDSNLHLEWDGSGLYMSEGSTIRRSTDFSTFSDESTGFTQNVERLTSLGNKIYAAVGTDGIYQRDGGTWSDLGSGRTADGVWEANSHLIASEGTDLFDVNLSTGSDTVLVTLPSGETWVDVAAAGSAILALSSGGVVYSITEDSGTLTLAAQTPTPGESPTAVGAVFGVVLIATKEEVDGGGAVGRLWRFNLADDLTLTGGQFLREWGHGGVTDSTEHVINSITATRDFLYFGVEEDDGSYIWRYSVEHGGLDRWLTAPSSGSVVSTVNAKSRLYFTIDAVGACKRDNTYETEGYLIGPLADHFTAVDKVWAGALIDIKSAPTDVNVELFYTTNPDAIEDPNHSSWVRAINNALVNQTEAALPNVKSRYLAGMVKITTNDTTYTAKVRSFAFRSYPGPSDVILRLPINSSDVYQRPGRKPKLIPGMGDEVRSFFQGKEGTYAEVKLLNSDEILSGVIKQVSTRAEETGYSQIKPVVTWVTFQGRQASDSGGSQDETAMGIGAMGVVRMG